MYGRLEDRFAKVAGFHSGEERAIFDDQGATAATHMHELMHDRIFYGTADGLFHLLALRISRDADESRIRAANEALVELLFNETRGAHEAAATYMGIEYLRTDFLTATTRTDTEKSQAAREYERLPPEYRSYYEVFGGLLNPLIRAPWVRLAIAWAITHWAFSSARLSKAMRLVADRAITPDEVPGPGARLAAAIHAIRNLGPAEWIEYVIQDTLAQCAKQQIVWTDIDDPSEWPDTAGAKKTEVTQTALFDTVRAWLDDRVVGSRWPHQLDEAVRELMGRHDFDFGERMDPLRYEVEDAILDARALVREAERARVYRQAQPGLQRFDWEALQAFACDLGSGALFLTVLASFRWGRKKYRAVLVNGATNAISCMTLNGKELRRLLRWLRRDRAAAAAHPPIIVCDLTLATSDVLSAITPLLSDAGFPVRKCQPPFDARIQSGAIVAINYVEQTLSSIMEHVPGAVYNLDVQTDSAGARSGVMLFVPEHPDVHACMKVVPRFDLGGYLVFQRALQNRGQLTVLSGQGADFAQSYVHMIKAVIDYWEPL